jgi:hypothetical protein
MGKIKNGAVTYETPFMWHSDVQRIEKDKS